MVISRASVTALSLATVLLAAAGTRAATPAAPASAAAPAAAPAAPAQWQILEGYCEKCHNVTDWAGDIAFDTMQPQEIAQDAKVWEAAVGKLQGRLMPPPGQKQPSQATVDGFVSWLQGRLDEAAKDTDPGYIPLHRLNRTQYARSVEELLGVSFDATSLLPKDTLEEGFDDIADVLKVSPTFLDQYITAASTVAGLAMGNPQAPRKSVSLSPERHDQTLHVEGLPLGTRGGYVAVHDFPADGDYELSLGAGGRGGGYNGGLQFREQLLFLLDGQKVAVQTLGGERDFKQSDQHRLEWAAELKERLKPLRVHVTAGPHQVGVTFVERSPAESDDWLQPLDPRGGLERIAQAGALQVVGPFEPRGVSDTPSRRKIFSCHPANESEELPCAKQIIAKLQRAAYRRPVTEEDLAVPLEFFVRGRQNASFDAGIENALIAILCSPSFLYRIEQTPAGMGPGGTFHISDVELASRLSFFLWSTGPDEELLEVAAGGKLHEREQLAQQVRRMLADPKAEALVTSFAFQWLQVNDMDGVTPDTAVYPQFDADLRSAFKQEMKLFLESVLLKDHNVCDLLTADYTFVNGRLALHYGIPNVRGDQFRRVTLTDPNRYGLLGKGAILMGTSYGNRTAPVLRGAWVFNDIIGEPPHAPPANIPPLKENVPGAKPLTILERMVMHRAVTSCNACHGLMDPIGLALENFDAIGRWRQKDYDTGTVIEASGEMAGGHAVKGPADVRRVLMTRPEQFVQTVTQKLMTYALGRPLEYHDMPTVRAVVREAAKSDDRFSALILGIAESPAFQMQRLPAKDGGAAKSAPLTTRAAHPPADPLTNVR